MSIQEKIDELKARHEKEKKELDEVVHALQNLPDLTGTAAEGIDPFIMVNPLYGARILIQYGTHPSGKQFTPMEALRVIERFELASCAAVRSGGGSLALRPSYFPLSEKKQETYEGGSGFFPATLNADSFGAGMEAWGALRDANKTESGNSTKLRIKLYLKDANKYAQYAPENVGSNRKWGEADDERIKRWKARATIKASKIISWWAPEGKSSFTYMWQSAHEAMEALGIPIESYCANYIQE